MLYSLLLLVVPLYAAGDHAGHQHRDETIAACECTTGITTADLETNCDDHHFAETLAALQEYLTDNECNQYCNNLMFMGSTEAAFRCYQVFALLTQYHDYCSTGTVDEELFHEYLEVCPDCYQNHYYVEGAPECDDHLNCTDTKHQIEDVELVLANCTTSCPATIIHDGETESCEEVWQHVEGYHRMCAHAELAVEFEELYDQAAFTSTVCNNTHCNVPWEINGTANCSTEYNMPYMMLREMYGDLNVTEIVMADDHSHGGGGNHSGHQHSNENITACECTTGITTEMLDTNCDDDDFETNLAALQAYLTANDCSQYCMNLMYMGTTEAAFKCYQVFSLIVQYHDYCASGTVDEELFHEYLEACPDCYQNHYYVEGAPECDDSLDCSDSEHLIEDVTLVLEDCIDECPSDIVHDGEHESCTEVWQHVEGYHRMCAHGDLPLEFDQLYDQAAFEETVCENIHCNVPWEINGTANCSEANNMQFNMLREMYGALDISGIVSTTPAPEDGMTSTVIADDNATTTAKPESGAYQLIVKVVGFVSILSLMFT